jgi:hypothetical protein
MSRPVQRSLRDDHDPLERARAAAQDARDIAREEKRRLPDWEDSDEVTARHDGLVQPHPVHVTVNLRDSQQEISQPKSDAPAKKQLNASAAQLATLLGLVLVTALVGLIQNCHH